MLKNVLELQSRQLVIVEKAVGDGERHPDLDASLTNTMTVNLTFFVEVFKNSYSDHSPRNHTFIEITKFT